MNKPTLHTGLAHLLKASGVGGQFPHVAFFSAYIPGDQDVLGAGISRLVKFRLLHPETPVLFLSFLPKKKLLTQDEFGVLQISGTEFVQLPFDKATILQLAEKHSFNSSTVSSEEWRSFSEKACRTLLHQKINVIKHKQDLAFINKVGLGLRLAVENVINYPEQRCCATLQDFNERYTAMQTYLQNPQIKDLIELSGIVQNSDDQFLKHTFELSNDFLFISNVCNKEKYIDLKEAILRIQQYITYFENLNPE